MRDVQAEINKVEVLIKTLEQNLSQLKAAVGDLSSQVSKPDYSEMPGETGYFDGFNMVTDSEEKYSVNPNYAAKSRILYGDNLKMIEEEGKTVFKLIDKQEKEKVEGVLNKKDGKWYLLTDKGTYRISDVAADYNNAEIQDSARALVPEGKYNVPFAALDKVNKDENTEISKDTVITEKNDEHTVDLKSNSKESEISLSTDSTQKEIKKSENNKNKEEKTKTKEDDSSKTVNKSKSKKKDEEIAEKEKEAEKSGESETEKKSGDNAEENTNSSNKKSQNEDDDNEDDKPDRVVQDFDIR